MKTILKFSLVVLVVMFSLNTYANNDDFLLKVEKESGNKISFSINEIEKANVTIYDKSYEVIYNEKATGKGGILRTYNLEEFPDGVYFLEVETNLKKVTHKIVIDNSVSSLSRTSVAEVYKGAFKMKNANVAATN